MFSVHKIIECICIRTYTTKFFLENYYFIKKKYIYCKDLDAPTSSTNYIFLQIKITEII